MRQAGAKTFGLGNTMTATVLAHLMGRGLIRRFFPANRRSGKAMIPQRFAQDGVYSPFSPESPLILAPQVFGLCPLSASD
jgi:hypothetical protein